MRLESPYFLLLLLALPWLFGGLSRRVRKESAGLSFSSPLSFTELGGSSWRTRSYNLVSHGLLFLALVVMVFALSRPQRGSAFREVEWSGRDIVLLLDISGSMLALDFSIDGRRADRLSALKMVMKEFLSKREGDRLGLVIFGDKVFTQSPLTLDRGAINQYIDRLQVGMAGQGTAIGDGLAIGLKRIKDIEAKSKVIILVTDGKNNSGKLGPIEGAELAKELGVKVHVVGIGSTAPAPIPMRSPFGGMTVVTRPMEYDEETLQKIAAISGGVYFNAQDTEGLQKVYQEIDLLEERREKVQEYLNYDELFPELLFFAVALLLLREFLLAKLFIRVPA